MPQPITGIKHLDTRAEALSERPELAARIAAIAVQYLAELFVALLGREEEAALAIYLELVDQNVRKAAFDALARTKLDAAALADFASLYERFRKVAKKRNRIVHGYWAISEDHTDGLLLLDIKDVHREDFAYKNTTFETWADERIWREASWKRIRVTKYTSADFSETFLKLKDLEDRIDAFRDRMWLVIRNGKPQPS
jgi:uncharacterized protein YutE (UPF0331/DUF86 family)